MKMKSYLTAVCAAALCLSTAGAQTLPEYFTTNNNTGTDFYLSFLPAWPVPGGVSNIKIYISSPVETDVTVEVASEGWVRTAKTKPNDVIEIVIPVTIAQPYFKTDRDMAPAEKVYRQHAIHVSSVDPIICYGMTRYQYTSDGFLALPVSALGMEYIIGSYADIGDNGTSVGQYLPSEAAIVAAFDNTDVVFTLGGSPGTQTSGGMTQGQTRTFSLNRGDVVALASFGKGADLSGSKVISNKPVGVISGNYCAYVPVDVAACDHLVDMEMPTHVWGKAYVVTSIHGRLKSSMIKVMAKEPNTTVYRDGVQIGVIQNAGGIEGEGYLALRVAEGTPASHIISADKPISVVQFNTGQQDDNIVSDPFQLVLTPAEQYTTNVVFNTPGIGDGSGFNYNYVNVVFELDDQGNIPADLEFGTINASGDVVWASVVSTFGSVFESLAQPIDGKSYGVKILTLPGDGVYHLRSSGKFAAYSYGFSDYDSYGMPAGALMADLTVVDLKAPLPSFTVASDGSVSNGSVVDISSGNGTSNLAKVALLHTDSYNYTFTKKSFIPGVDGNAQWSLQVEDPSKPARATLLFVDRVGNDTTVVIDHAATTGVGDEQPAIAATVLPQPATDAASLQFTLAMSSQVRVVLYSEVGEETAVLLDEMRGAGSHTVNISTAKLSAGVYLYRLTAGSEVLTGRLTVVK